MQGSRSTLSSCAVIGWFFCRKTKFSIVLQCVPEYQNIESLRSPSQNTKREPNGSNHRQCNARRIMCNHMAISKKFIFLPWHWKCTVPGSSITPKKVKEIDLSVLFPRSNKQSQNSNSCNLMIFFFDDTEKIINE